MFGWECQQQREIENNREPCGSLFVLYDDLAVGTVDGERSCFLTPLASLDNYIPLLHGAVKVNLF